jgi:TPR repeat protein
LVSQTSGIGYQDPGGRIDETHFSGTYFDSGSSRLGAADLGAGFDKGREAYVTGDHATALQELRPLAEQGNGAAQLILGTMYYVGKGVPQSYTEAVKWYRMAAEQGYARAQNNLGLMYHKGEGVLQDYAEAVKWYRLAAEQGLADAQNNLGFMYVFGKGVLQDDLYAHMWFNTAASLGAESSSENRASVASRMTAEDIPKAQAMARDCVAKDYKAC